MYGSPAEAKPLGTMIHDHLGNLMLAGIAGYCIDRAAEKCVPKDLVLGPGIPEPRWKLYVCIAYQAFILPTIFFLAWSSHGFPLRWFKCSWEELGDAKYENFYIYCLFSYLIKDIFWLDSIGLFWHHVACIALILSSWWYPVGGCGVIFASMELEIGTLAFNLKKLWPQRFTRLHAVVMTLSNIILLGLCAWHWTWDEFTWVPKAASTLACIALVTGRQFEGEVPLPQGVAKWLASDSDKME